MTIHVRSFVSADPVRIAMWSVASVLISYCGAPLLVWIVQVVNSTRRRDNARDPLADPTGLRMLREVFRTLDRLCHH
jgi:hypothetical protein